MLRILAPAALVLSALPAAAQAEAVFIKNASFESQVLADGQFIPGSVTDWYNDVGPEHGAQNPLAATFASVPDGQNSAYVGSYLTGLFGAPVSGRLSQVLGVSATKGMRYTLSVDVGRRGDGYDLPIFTASLLSGGTTLASGTFTDADIAPGQFRTLTFSFDALVNSAGPLRIAFQSFYDPAQGLAYRQVNFDNVRLDASPIPTTGVPEPAAWALMIAGFGLAGAAMRRRRPIAALA